MLQASDAELAGGVVTASAGNMAQGVAYAARLRGVPATIVVPEGAPETKLAAFGASAAASSRCPTTTGGACSSTGRYEGADGLFVHPVDDARVMAGNGTIGLELLEDLPELDAVVVPYGGGGLLTGIASASRRSGPRCAFYSAEPETGAPAARDARDGRAGRGRVHAARSSTARAAAR